MSDLPYTLRQGAIALSEDSSLNWVRDEMRSAADAIEGYEQALLDISGWENWQTPTWREIARNALPEHAECKRLEHEAITPEIDLGSDVATFTSDDESED